MASQPDSGKHITDAALPPLQKKTTVLVGPSQNPQAGLPSDTAFTITPYRSSLGLTYVSRPSLAVGSSSFGTYIGGGASLYFSDILGNHNLVTGLQVQGTLKDVYALLGYQNLTHRLNWAVIADQTPYLTGAFNEGYADLNGQAVFVQQQLLERQTNRDFQFQVSYPFSQAQRIDLSTGYTNISFDNQLKTAAFDPVTGDQVLDSTQDLPSLHSLNLGTASLALVYDNSFFGATAPILGQRYRLR